MYSDIVDAVVDVLNHIPGIGQVHGYVRYAATSDRFLRFFKSTINGVDQIRGWIVSLDTRDPLTVTDLTFGGELRERYQVLVSGVMGVNDVAASERAFATLCEQVVRTLTHCDLPLAGVLSQEADVAAWRVFEHRLFGDVLVHYSEIVLPVFVVRGE